MSASTLTVEQRSLSWAARLSDYVELTKPRIMMLVLVAVAAAGYVASWGQPDPLALLHAFIGTTLVAASASALNQWLERHCDALMPRTAERPLPAGRLSSRSVTCFAAGTIVAGELYLLVTVGWQTAVWGLLTWLVYVWVYTPLKSRTSWNTFVGAIAGALPMLIGWTAVGGTLDMRAAALFSIMFVWQFPHFMAIAWMYRRQYSAAGLKMLTVVDPTGRRAGVQAVLAAAALLPVSLVPAIDAPTTGALWYVVPTFLLGLGQLACAVYFFRKLDHSAAKWLLRASLVYLPAVLALLMFLPLL